jgi:hypothetical protein
MKRVWIILGLLICATPGYSQTRSVVVLSENADTKEVADAVRARIAASSRYTVQPSGAEIVVDVLCIYTKTIARYSCSYDFTYFPKGMSGLSTNLGTSGIILDNDSLVIAEKIFERAVAASTEDVLSAAKSMLTLQIQSFCSNPSNHTVCSPKIR